MTGRGRVAVVTVVHGRHEHLRRQEASLAAGGRQPDVRVGVAMGDPVLARRAATDPGWDSLDADPGRLPLAAARNAGARRALDLGADVLVFLDVDCLAGPELVAGYEHAALDDPGTIWSGPVTYLPAGLDERQLSHPWLLDDPHPARPAPAPGVRSIGADPDLFWSLSFALTSEAWLRSGGFHEEYVGYGGEDTDFALQAVGRGLDLGWVGDARAYHQHHPVSEPPVEHLDDILRNGRVFHRRWGRWPMEGWLQEFESLGLVRRTAQGWERA